MAGGAFCRGRRERDRNRCGGQRDGNPAGDKFASGEHRAGDPAFRASRYRVSRRYSAAPGAHGDRLEAPGACDNAAGVVGMLAVVHALLRAGVELPAPLVVLGNVGEEGEGDLRGVRHFYEHSALAGRVAAHIVLDGAGADAAVTQALGSRRYRVTVTGPGGHSFSDAGTPNPIAALAMALAAVAETHCPKSRGPRSMWERYAAASA